MIAETFRFVTRGVASARRSLWKRHLADHVVVRRAHHLCHGRS